MSKLDAVRKDFKSMNLFANVAFLAAASAALGLTEENAFKANKTLESKHLKMLEELEGSQLDILSAVIAAYKSAPEAAADPLDDEMPGEGDPNNDDDPNGDPNAMKTKTNRAASEPVTMTRGELSTLIANEVASAVSKAITTAVPEQARRAEVSSKLKANAANPFSDEDLDSLPVDALEKFELSLRANDYSGAGGFAVHSGREEDDRPLAVIANERRAAADKARKDRRAA